MLYIYQMVVFLAGCARLEWGWSPLDAPLSGVHVWSKRMDGWVDGGLVGMR
jgi:hypothetical protein